MLFLSMEPRAKGNAVSVMPRIQFLITERRSLVRSYISGSTSAMRERMLESSCLFYSVFLADDNIRSVELGFDESAGDRQHFGRQADKIQAVGRVYIAELSANEPLCLKSRIAAAWRPSTQRS